MKFHTQVLLTILAVAALAVVGRQARAVNQPSQLGDNAHFETPTPQAPGIPTNLTVTASGSLGTTLSVKGACVRITCSQECFYRVTAGSSTAVATDNELPGQTPERFCLIGTQDSLTFFNANGASITANVAVASGPP